VRELYSSSVSERRSWISPQRIHFVCFVCFVVNSDYMDPAWPYWMQLRAGPNNSVLPPANHANRRESPEVVRPI
jgi:hypothetical protein